jgi:drug/metabolite transporter (DMT)-like permease
VVCATSLAVLLVITRGRMIATKQTLVFSFFLWASSVCWIFGLSYISSAQSAILSFTMPLFAIPLSIFLLGERSSRVEVYGGLVGFSGVVLYNVPLLSGGSTILGVALALSNAFFWASFSVYWRKLSSQDPLQTLTTATMLCLVLWVVLASVDFGIRPTANLAFDLLYLGLASGIVALFLWAALLKTERIAKLTVIIFITPVITLAYGIATTRVIPSYITLAGVALIFVGIYASNILGQRGGAASSDRPKGPALGSEPSAPDQQP